MSDTVSEYLIDKHLALICTDSSMHYLVLQLKSSTFNLSSFISHELFHQPFFIKLLDPSCHQTSEINLTFGIETEFFFNVSEIHHTVSIHNFFLCIIFSVAYMLLPSNSCVSLSVFVLSSSLSPCILNHNLSHLQLNLYCATLFLYKIFLILINYIMCVSKRLTERVCGVDKKFPRVSTFRHPTINILHE